MIINHNPHWDSLQDWNMHKTDLRFTADITMRQHARSGKNIDISIETLSRICTVPVCAQ